MHIWIPQTMLQYPKLWFPESENICEQLTWVGANAMQLIAHCPFVVAVQPRCPAIAPMWDR